MPKKVLTTTIRLNQADKKRIEVRTKRMLYNIPKIGRRTVNTVAKKGQQEAKKIVERKEATFAWQGKGELRDSINIIPGRQNKEVNEVKLVALAPHALLVEEGIRSGQIPVRRRWRSNPKLASWINGLMGATGITRMPGTITVSATASSQVRPIAWGTEGMGYMEGAFQIMIPYAQSQIDKIKREII